MADKRIIDFTESVSAGADYYLVTDSLNDGVKKIKTSNIVSKTDLGLGNVDNTSDASKPISGATQTALDLKSDKATTISAGTGLTGGGDLTTNRSIALSSASVASLSLADGALQRSGGTMTGGITAAQSGHFYEPDGAIVERFGDRVFTGGAVENTAAQTSTNNDWLTTFQISTGRTSGFIQTSQSAILTSDNANSLSALTLASQSVNSPGNFIGAAGINAVGVSNCTTYSAGAWAGYFEAYRMAGTAGAVGVEIDVINFASESGTEPFTQSTGQTVGFQLGAGGDLPSTGQYSVSAAINVRANGSTFARGIVIGSDAIKGTDGTTGAGEAIGLATGHVINYYYGSGTVSWQLGAGFGVNGDYTITSQGTGSVSVPSLKTPEIKFPATQVPSSDVNTLDDYEEGTFTPVVSFGGVSTGITYSKQVGKYTKVGNRVDAALEIILTSKGTATGMLNIAGLPFPVTAALSPPANVRCANLDSSFSSQPAGIFVSGQSNVNLAKIVAGAGVGLADTDITNTAVIRVSGHYFVD